MVIKNSYLSITPVCANFDEYFECVFSKVLYSRL